MSITEVHIAHYREHGYAIVENFLTPDELAGARAEIDVRLPGWLDYADDSSRPKPDGWDQPRSSRRTGRFPFSGTHLNAITLHPKLRAFAAEMAGHNDLHCEQSDLSYKCKDHPGDRDQAMHCDYRNHTLAYPPDDPAYWQTAYLLYYTDVDEYHAPTAVCSRQHYPEKPLWPSSYTREERPELYENEVKVVVLYCLILGRIKNGASTLYLCFLIF